MLTKEDLKLGKKELVGYITVDAGLVQIGDPCYLSKDNGNPYENWSEFCAGLLKNEQNGVLNIDHANGSEGMAIAVNTAYGDGIFPVYVRRDKNGGITEMTVNFNPFK
jgi:hypothetical protein